jgi:hypothetical protein
LLITQLLADWQSMAKHGATADVAVAGDATVTAAFIHFLSVQLLLL